MSKKDKPYATQSRDTREGERATEYCVMHLADYITDPETGKMKAVVSPLQYLEFAVATTEEWVRLNPERVQRIPVHVGLHEQIFKSDTLISRLIKLSKELGYVFYHDKVLPGKMYFRVGHPIMSMVRAGRVISESDKGVFMQDDDNLEPLEEFVDDDFNEVIEDDDETVVVEFDDEENIYIGVQHPVLSDDYLTAVDTAKIVFKSIVGQEADSVCLPVDDNEIDENEVMSYDYTKGFVFVGKHHTEVEVANDLLVAFHLDEGRVL